MLGVILGILWNPTLDSYRYGEEKRRLDELIAQLIPGKKYILKGERNSRKFAKRGIFLSRDGNQLYFDSIVLYYDLHHFLTSPHLHQYVRRGEYEYQDERVIINNIIEIVVTNPK